MSQPAYVTRTQLAVAILLTALATLAGLLVVTAVSQRSAEDNRFRVDEVCTVMRGVIEEVRPVIPAELYDGVQGRLEPLCPTLSADIPGF